MSDSWETLAAHAYGRLNCGSTRPVAAMHEIYVAILNNAVIEIRSDWICVSIDNTSVFHYVIKVFKLNLLDVFFGWNNRFCLHM